MKATQEQLNTLFQLLYDKWLYKLRDAERAFYEAEMELRQLTE